MSKTFGGATVAPTGEIDRGFFARNDKERYRVTLHPNVTFRLPVMLEVWAKSDDEARAEAKFQLDRYNAFYEEEEARKARVQQVKA